jgi:F-type H+-transporting ATPase subunit b
MQIDWLTVAAQIVNFLVLVWLLQRFLYRPITDAMARREERIAMRLAEAKDAHAEVAAEAERLRERHAALDASRDEALRDVEAEATALRARLEAELREEMAAKRRTWEAHLEDEREDFAAQLRQRAGHQVIDIVGRILADYAGADLAEQLSGTFAERLADLEPEMVAKLSAAAGRAKGPARVYSSVTLKPGARTGITRAIHAMIAPEIEVEYREDRDLLLGIRLTIGEQTVEWSAARFLSRLESSLDETIESSRRPPDRGLLNTA